jgi:Flp pilus assembly protein TadG
MLRLLRQLNENESGAAAIEFAVVSGAFFMLMFGIIEYGMIMLTQIAIESATNQVGRSASLGNVSPGCADRVCSIRAIVTEKTASLVDPQSINVSSTVVSSPTTATPPIADICLDNPATPYPPTGGCRVFQNNDGIAGYQQRGSLSTGTIGGAGEVVEIRVTYLWPVLFPIFRSSFGTNGVLTISSSTVVKNEPFN